MIPANRARKKPGKDPRFPYAWEVIPEALEEAYEILGLRCRARVYHRPFKHMEGSYDGVNDRGEHIIALAVNLRSDHASRTLWHELWHAVQAEKMGQSLFEHIYDAQRRANGVRWSEIYKGSGPALRAYKAMPLEQEAWQAEKLDKELRLCRNGRR